MFRLPPRSTLANSRIYKRLIEHDYQTVEYCGCTDPTDQDYWELATFHDPKQCRRSVDSAVVTGAAGTPTRTQERWNVDLDNTELFTVLGRDRGHTGGR